MNLPKLLAILLFLALMATGLQAQQTVFIPLHVLHGHGNNVNHCEFSPDNKTMLTVGADLNAILWDVATGAPIRTFTNHKNYIIDGTFSPDGRLIATGSDDGTVIIWDVATGTQLKQISPGHGWVMGVSFSPDGTYLAVSGYDGSITAWNLNDYSLRWGTQASGSDHAIRDLIITKDSKHIYTSAVDEMAQCIDAANGTLVATFKGHQGWANSVAVTSNESVVATGSYDQTIKLWTKTGGLLQTLNPDGTSTSSVAFSPDNRYLISSHYSGTTFLRDMQANNVAGIVNPGHKVNLDARFSNDGVLVGTTYIDGYAIIWRPTPMTCTVEGHCNDYTLTFAFPDSWLSLADLQRINVTASNGVIISQTNIKVPDSLLIRVTVRTTDPANPTVVSLAMRTDGSDLTTFFSKTLPGFNAGLQGITASTGIQAHGALGTVQCDSGWFQNLSQQPLTLTRAYFTSGPFCSVSAPQFPLTLPPNSGVMVHYCCRISQFNPVTDTLVFTDDCRRTWKYPYVMKADPPIPTIHAECGRYELTWSFYGSGLDPAEFQSMNVTAVNGTVISMVKVPDSLVIRAVVQTTDPTKTTSVSLTVAGRAGGTITIYTKTFPTFNAGLEGISTSTGIQPHGAFGDAKCDSVRFLNQTAESVTLTSANLLSGKFYTLTAIPVPVVVAPGAGVFIKYCYRINTFDPPADTLTFTDGCGHSWKYPLKLKVDSLPGRFLSSVQSQCGRYELTWSFYGSGLNPAEFQSMNVRASNGTIIRVIKVTDSMVVRALIQHDDPGMPTNVRLTITTRTGDTVTVYTKTFSSQLISLQSMDAPAKFQPHGALGDIKCDSLRFRNLSGQPLRLALVYLLSGRYCSLSRPWSPMTLQPDQQLTIGYCCVFNALDPPADTLIFVDSCGHSWKYPMTIKMDSIPGRFLSSVRTDCGQHVFTWSFDGIGMDPAELQKLNVTVTGGVVKSMVRVPDSMIIRAVVQESFYAKTITVSLSLAARAGVRTVYSKTLPALSTGSYAGLLGVDLVSGFQVHGVFGDQRCDSVRFLNRSDVPFILSKTWFISGKHCTVNMPQLPLTIPPNSGITVKYCYTINTLDPPADTLVFQDGCGNKWGYPFTINMDGIPDTYLSSVQSQCDRHELTWTLEGLGLDVAEFQSITVTASGGTVLSLQKTQSDQLVKAVVQTTNFTMVTTVSLTLTTRSGKALTLYTRTFPVKNIGLYKRNNGALLQSSCEAGAPKCDTTRFYNNSDMAVILTTAHFASGKNLTLASPQAPVTLQPDSSVVVTICYTSNQITDMIDTLIFTDDCGHKWWYPVTIHTMPLQGSILTTASQICGTREVTFTLAGPPVLHFDLTSVAASTLDNMALGAIRISPDGRKLTLLVSLVNTSRQGWYEVDIKDALGVARTHYSGVISSAIAQLQGIDSKTGLRLHGAIGKSFSGDLLLVNTSTTPLYVPGAAFASGNNFTITAPQFPLTLKPYSSVNIHYTCTVRDFNTVRDTLVVPDTCGGIYTGPVELTADPLETGICDTRIMLLGISPDKKLASVSMGPGDRSVIVLASVTDAHVIFISAYGSAVEYDMAGRQKADIDLAELGLPSGWYQVVVRSAGQILAQRSVIFAR